MAAPAWAASESYEYLGSEDISKDRYTEADFAKGEFERLWTRTWQMACREEHIPEAGDYYVYDIGPYSFVVTRGRRWTRFAPTSTPACIAAPSSSPPATTGFANDLKCPFHGWTWNLDGRIKAIPEKWDFAHIEGRTNCLPEARVARLGGFVWINMDPDAPSLEEYLGPRKCWRISKAWKLEDRYIYLHVQKSYPANWKLTMEAFMEAYHVGDTHPQVAPGERRRQLAVRRLWRARRPLHLDARRGQPQALRQVSASRTSSRISRWETARRWAAASPS